MVDPKYLNISFDKSGVRNSQKRLKELISEAAIEPIKTFDTELAGDFDLVETIVRQRIADVIAYWAENKHDPVVPRPSDMMNHITNGSKHDVTLAEFYSAEVKSALQTLAPDLLLEMPDDYTPRLTLLEQTLSQTLRPDQADDGYDEDEDDPESESDDDEALYDDDEALEALTAPPAAVSFAEREEAVPPVRADKNSRDRNHDRDRDQKSHTPAREDIAPLAAPAVTQARRAPAPEAAPDEAVYEEVDAMDSPREQERAIVAAPAHQLIGVADTALQDGMLSLGAQEAWQLIYGLIGYRTEYIQQTLLPRWQQNPAAFDKDRRFLYGLFLDTLRNASGVQTIAGHYLFRDSRLTLDALWTHYFADLSQNVAPQLAAARIQNDANDPWYKKQWKSFQEKAGNISPMWMVALLIALVLDAMTTYISLDQTPMEGAMVLMFTILITALFQIADQLVISYRKREFEAEALAAKFHAQYERLAQELTKLDMTSESYVHLSMTKSQAHANWKAAEDNRKMARRGRFWTARIADINVVVTAYGFSFLFLNAREPMDAIVDQIEAIFVRSDLRGVDPWIFLMIALAITVSFVINTAQRTEILGWAMRRLKEEA